MKAPKIIRKTLIFTANGGVTPRIKNSNIIVKNIENLLNTVNMGRLIFWVPPRPETRFKTKNSGNGKI